MMAAAFIARARRIARVCALCAVALATVMHGAAWAQAAEPPRLITHQSYVEDTLRPTELRLDDPSAVFAWVLGSLPERVKVYPTENYFYFHFVHNGLRYAGNIRLDAKDRDRGKLHFAYFEDLAEWREEPAMNYRVFDKAAGVAVEKLERFLYRVTYRDKSVLFELNDLTAVAPPPGVMLADESYLGPVFDNSAIRFFLIYNARLKVFHYVLDETLAVNEHFLTAARDRPDPDRQAQRLRLLSRPAQRPKDPDRRVRGQRPRQQRLRRSVRPVARQFHSG